MRYHAAMVTLIIFVLIAAGLVLVPSFPVLGIALLCLAGFAWRWHTPQDEANFMAVLGALAFIGSVGLTLAELIRRWL